MTAQATSEAATAAARSEAQRMIAAVATVDDETAVTMKAGQFRKLAQLLESIAAAAMCREESKFDAPIDGIRFWVPLSYLEAERERFAAAVAFTPMRASVDDRLSF